MNPRYIPSESGLPSNHLKVAAAQRLSPILSPDAPCLCEISGLAPPNRLSAHRRLRAAPGERSPPPRNRARAESKGSVSLTAGLPLGKCSTYGMVQPVGDAV